MSTLSKIEQEIASKKAELEALENRAKEVAQQEIDFPEGLLAEELHGMLCRWNHTDGCSWHYEINRGVVDWNGHAHSDYLRRARLLISTCKTLDITTAKALEITRIVNALK